MIYAEQLIKSWLQTQNNAGWWVLARPEKGPILWRLKDAWRVLKGECDALKWEDQ